LRRYKQEVVVRRLSSPEGINHLKKRSIEPESVFGQMKYNKQYNRFRHFGKDMVKMDFAIFAIAFNLAKMAKKYNNLLKNRPTLCFYSFLRLLKLIYPVETRKSCMPDKSKLAWAA
jgi:hypothetical protein